MFRIAENDVHKRTIKQKRGKSNCDKSKKSNSATSNVDKSVYCVDESDLLEFWHEIELDEELFSIDEEELDGFQNSGNILDSSSGFYLDFLQENDADSTPSSPLSTPIDSPISSPLSHSHSYVDGEISDSPAFGGSSSDEANSPLPTEILKQDSRKRTLENKQSRKTQKKSRRSTKNFPTKSKLSTEVTNEELSVLCVVENSPTIPATKKRKSSTKKTSRKYKKNIAEIFKSNEVLKLEAVSEDENVDIDIGDASDFTNYN